MKNIEDIFPVTLRVPLFFVWFTKRGDTQLCTGAKLLKKILKDNNITDYTNLSWYVTTGYFTHPKENGTFMIISDKNMFLVKPWTKVTYKCIFIPNI